MSLCWHLGPSWSRARWAQVKGSLGEGWEPGQLSLCHTSQQRAGESRDSKPGPGLGLAGYHEEIFTRVRPLNIF